MKALTLTAEMASAAISGDKTETRRPVKLPAGFSPTIVRHHYYHSVWGADSWVLERDRESFGVRLPFGLPGTELWLREPGIVTATNINGPESYSVDIKYPSDGEVREVRFPNHLLIGTFCLPPKWARLCRGIPNGIFREAARFKTAVTEVRVERLQQISRESIRAEGFTLPPSPRFTPGEFSELHQEFAHTWNRIYGKRPGLAWADNPWVSVTKFRPMEAK